MPNETHTLLLVEEEVETNPDVYQSTLLGHPPDDTRPSL